MKAFLRYYIELPFPAKEIDAVIAGLPGEWLDVAAQEANIRGLLMLGTAPRADQAEATAGELCVTVAPRELEGTVLRRAMKWLAVQSDSVASVLRGDLELAELGPTRTQLTLSAQYRPFVPAVDQADGSTAQRVGESTLKAFVDQLATYIQAVLGRAPAAVTPVEPLAAIRVKPYELGRGWVAAPEDRGRYGEQGY